MVDKTTFVFFVVLIVGLLFAGFVIATHSTNPSSFNVNQSRGYVYTIQVDVSDAGQLANVTQVNITLPGGFAFGAGSNATSAFGTFLNTSNVLVWTNTTFFLINGSSSATFSFNATSSTLGLYNFTVMSRNGTSSYFTNISVRVNDGAMPHNLSFISSTADNSARNSIEVNVSAVDDNGLDNLKVYLWGSSGLINNTNFNVSGTSASVFINFTSLSEGQYYVNFSANDSYGNENLTSETKSIGLYYGKPVITLSSPSDGTSSATSSHNFTFYVWAPSSLSISECFLIFDGTKINRLTSVSKTNLNGMYNSSLSVASHNWSINCTDSNGGKGNSSTRSLRITASTSDDDDDGDDGGGVSVTSYWYATYTVTNEQLSEGYTRELQNHYRIQIKIDNETHHVGVVGINGDKATINVSSNPQQAVLKVGESKKFELTDDYYYDLNVTLLNLTSSKAKLFLQSIHQEMTTEERNALASTAPSAVLNNNEGALNLSSKGKESSSDGLSWWVWLLIIIFLVVVCAGGVLYYFYLQNLKKLGYN